MCKKYFLVPNEAIFASVLSFYLYAKTWKNQAVKVISRLFAPAVKVLCYFIKPYCAITMIAILLLEFIGLWQDFCVKKFARFTALGMAAFLTFSCVNRLIGLENAKIGLHLDGASIGSENMFRLAHRKIRKRVLLDEIV